VYPPTNVGSVKEFMKALSIACGGIHDDISGLEVGEGRELSTDKKVVRMYAKISIVVVSCLLLCALRHLFDVFLLKMTLWSVRRFGWLSGTINRSGRISGTTTLGIGSQTILGDRYGGFPGIEQRPLHDGEEKG
jgi:hypothetical protein